MNSLHFSTFWYFAFYVLIFFINTFDFSLRFCIFFLFTTNTFSLTLIKQTQTINNKDQHKQYDNNFNNIFDCVSSLLDRIFNNLILLLLRKWRLSTTGYFSVTDAHLKLIFLLIINWFELISRFYIRIVVAHPFWCWLWTEFKLKLLWRPLNQSGRSFYPIKVLLIFLWIIILSFDQRREQWCSILLLMNLINRLQPFTLIWLRNDITWPLITFFYDVT